jgi:hypothetical protein
MSEGNERRGQFEQFGDLILDNDLVEGQEVATLRRLVTEQRWTEVTKYTQKLRKAGHGQSRVESMISRAMAGLKF